MYAAATHVLISIIAGRRRPSPETLGASAAIGKCCDWRHRPIRGGGNAIVVLRKHGVHRCLPSCRGCLQVSGCLKGKRDAHRWLRPCRPANGLPTEVVGAAVRQTVGICPAHGPSAGTTGVARTDFLRSLNTVASDSRPVMLIDSRDECHFPEGPIVQRVLYLSMILYCRRGLRWDPVDAYRDMCNAVAFGKDRNIDVDEQTFR
jgi:hypothetical protein